MLIKKILAQEPVTTCIQLECYAINITLIVVLSESIYMIPIQYEMLSCSSGRVMRFFEVIYLSAYTVNYRDLLYIYDRIQCTPPRSVLQLLLLVYVLRRWMRNCCRLKGKSPRSIHAQRHFRKNYWAVDMHVHHCSMCESEFSICLMK